MIPAMTTGTVDFKISSGRMTPIAEMPTPDLAVPYAAPKPTLLLSHSKLLQKITDAAAPRAPRKGAYAGHSSVTEAISKCLYYRGT